MSGGRAGPAALPTIRVGMPLPAGRLLEYGIMSGGLPLMFSANAFAKYRDGSFRGFRLNAASAIPPNVDAALDSAGFTAAAHYGDYRFSVSAYLDLVANRDRNQVPMAEVRAGQALRRGAGVSPPVPDQSEDGPGVVAQGELRALLGHRYVKSAASYFDAWSTRAMRSRIEPIKQVVGVLRRHREGLLNYTKHRITNAPADGFNSIIQTIKANARGFRSFENFRIRILFFCGKLDLSSASAQSH